MTAKEVKSEVPTEKKATTVECKADTKEFEGTCFPDKYYKYMDLKLCNNDEKYSIDGKPRPAPKPTPKPVSKEKTKDATVKSTEKSDAAPAGGTKTASQKHTASSSTTGTTKTVKK